MADSLKARFDSSAWDKIFAKLDGPIKESLARRMGHAGGKVMRDEAKRRAPKGIADEKPVKQYGGSITPGLLESAIYVAYNERLSKGGQQFAYSVRWNHKKAPHGWWEEFGHTFHYAYWFGPKSKGNPEIGWWSSKKHPLDTPKWIPGSAYLGGAYDAMRDQARNVMIETGRVELPKLLAGQ